MTFLLWHHVRDRTEENPDGLAITDGRSELTYLELMRAARRAAALMVEQGVRPGDRVGILASKSVQCVATMLAASLAGAVYVPVDPRAPAVRSKFILGNAAIRFLVTESALLRSLELAPGADGVPGEEQILLLDDGGAAGNLVPGAARWDDLADRTAAFEPADRNEHDPAFMLYTSGSTGHPKGVVISHRNALTFVNWGRATFGLQPSDRLSNHAPFHFDLSVFDIYGALSSGASVHLVPDRIAPFPTSLAKWIEETGITVWYSVPSALVRILLHGDPGRFSFDQVRTVLFAGEVFPVKHLRAVMDVFGSAEFHNLYGPTETNVCTHFPVPRPLPEEMTDLPIGPACPNMEAFALTADGKRAGVGEEGELLVRGPCVMLGYWNMPERTARSLGQSPLHSDFTDLIYRTGDQVQVLGGMEGFKFLGRRDHMVKVRGYRVELGEIERAMLAHEAVREAAVVAVEDDEVGARLYGAVALAEGQSLDLAELGRHCLSLLPRYAVPEATTVVDALPRTSNGKTDRMALKRQFTDSPTPTP